MRTRRRVTALAATAVALAAASGCGGADDVAARPVVTVPAEVVTTRTFPPAVPAAPLTFEAVPPPMTSGNPAGSAVVPAEAQAVDTSQPTRVIGTGTAESCTSQAVVDAVAAGGIITFDCGAAPVTITMTATAKVVNANGPQIVLDGGGLVTLSGGGERRILYMNTCDEAQGWTTSHCQDQDHPQLTVQNLTFADGNSTGELTEGGGGGAIFVRGGRFRVVSQYQNLPVYVVSSTFGGAPGEGGSCSNGGAVSSIGVSWVILNSVMTFNEAIGNGANPADAGTPGGGSGGAIYNDGNMFTVLIARSIIEDNHANEGGGAIFFVSNDGTGTLTIASSTLQRNPSGQFQTQPGIFFMGSGGAPATPGSTVR